MKYDKPGQDPVAAGRALKVDAVLDGLIQRTGDRVRAFECLDKALEEREWWSFSVKVNPLFERLHSDPRFADLVRRTGLTP